MDSNVTHNYCITAPLPRAQFARSCSVLTRASSANPYQTLPYAYYGNITSVLPLSALKTSKWFSRKKY
eukprot:1157729-Pelagomonas_calceolata.AAC.5